MNSRRRNKNIPDRWTDYLPINEILNEIRIVPFKVPLPVRLFEEYPLKGYKWTPTDVINCVPDLGLVIDLTFKNPCYYEPLEFLENGIDYIKIGCPGHVLPNEETFMHFCTTVEQFLAENSDLIVGVHCTHGVNRTGYMVCRYMVERQGYIAEEALDIFALKRGYRIERENYIQKILCSESSNCQK